MRLAPALRSRALFAVALPAALAAGLLLSGAARRGATQEAPPREWPPGAMVDQHLAMLADKRGTYGPADGGGSARLVEPVDAVAGGRARFVLEYRAGPLGIAAGGALFLQVSPFWGWSTPQVVDPFSAGFTTVTCSDAAVTVTAETVAPQCLRIRIDGAPLPADATLTIDYGAGVERAIVDRFAESAEAFYFWVDGDGDGTRKLIAADPRVAIKAGPPMDLRVTAPSEAGVGAPFELTLAFLDAAANAAPDFTGAVALAGAGLELPATVDFTAADRGRRKVMARALDAGIRTVVAHAAGRDSSSNPILVSTAPRTLLWADLHGHSQLSDGTATPVEYFEYARDVAGLDVAVLTDHDHWGLRKLDMEAGLFEQIAAATRAFDAPGRFTTLHGLEWTSWIHGHRHILWFDDAPAVISSLDPGTDSPQGLWAALRAAQANAMTLAHHSGGGPVPTNWEIAPDPHFEPLVEIVSVHGSSEASDGPRPIYAPKKGHFVRDALRRGYRLGFAGSGDSHNGHPGLTHLGQPCGGVTAILAAENTRPAIAAALRARTCYATSGPRILLWFRLGAERMGAVVAPPADPAAKSRYLGLALGTAPLARIEIWKNGARVAAVAGDGTFERSLEFVDSERRSGDHVYFRVLQEDGHAAWSSPIFTE
ncbi:MAG: DUF3604 domain-containing protein [Planctomycetes bacterium]|nr:DUF3604 domain-containing protein [Planctomycetota bacterium]